MQALVLILHVLVAVCLIVLILLQHGKGADVGATFGSGASNTMFGSVGPAPFLMKLTSALAAIFFLTSLTLGYFLDRPAPVANQWPNIPASQAPASSAQQPVPVSNAPATLPTTNGANKK